MRPGFLLLLLQQLAINPHHFLRCSETAEPVDVYGHVTAMSSSPDLTQSHSSDLSPKNPGAVRMNVGMAASSAGRSGAGTSGAFVGAGAAAAVDATDASPGRRQAALGRRGSVELTKSEEDLFNEGKRVHSVQDCMFLLPVLARLSLTQ